MARPAPAVDRALSIIELLVSRPEQRVTLSDVVRRTGMSLGSAHAVLTALERTGYIRRHPQHKTYALGPALVAAGVAALDQQPAVREASARIDDLARELDADVSVTVATGTEIIFVASARHSGYGPGFRAGERFPLIPPVGAVFLAWAPAADVEAWLQRGAGGAVLMRRAQESLDAVRQRGYSVNLNSPQQFEFVAAVHERREDLPSLAAAVDQYAVSDFDFDASYDVSTIAAPVFDSESKVVAAITGMGFPPDLSAGEVVDTAERLRAAATAVTKRSGGRPIT